jgi:hypothetical protein
MIPDSNSKVKALNRTRPVSKGSPAAKETPAKEAKSAKVAPAPVRCLSDGVDSVHWQRPPAAPSKPMPSIDLDEAKAPKPAQISAWNFDWDDNIFRMPTEIMLVHSETGKEKGVSTDDWALVRSQLGKEGPWEKFVIGDKTMRFFGDESADGRNHFFQDMISAMTRTPRDWKGPVIDDAVEALSHEEVAPYVTVITARGHSGESMHFGLELMQALGFFKHLPPKENLIGVTNPEFQKELGGTVQSPSDAKVIVMKGFLDKIQENGLGTGAVPVLSREGEGKLPLHLWGFSDDDYGNYSKAVEALSEEVKKGRWPDIKITVFFTGTNHPTEKPRAEVLTPGGGTRPMTEGERPEAKQVIRALQQSKLTRPTPAKLASKTVTFKEG